MKRRWGKTKVSKICYDSFWNNIADCCMIIPYKIETDYLEDDVVTIYGICDKFDEVSEVDVIPEYIFTFEVLDDGNVVIKNVRRL